MRRRNLVSLVAAVGLAASMLATPSMADDKRVLRVVPHSNLSVLDPIWTTAYITRNYGYMVYDTLFSEDSKGRIRPQMVDTYTSSADLKTWRFKLRPGLKFHDGAKVTSADVVASIKRWGAKDAFGGVLMANVDSFDTPTEDHFVIKLKSPSGIVVDALGKVSSNVPFIMPARLANTPANEQVKEAIGSGPYKFVADEFVSGSKVVFEKFADYAPRTEAADGLAGGKVVNFDRVEWVIIKDAETAVNALRAGEVDMIEQLPFEKYYSVKKMDGIKVEDYSPAGLQYILRFNHTLPPFDNVKVRQAAMMALTQAAFIKIQVGVPELGRLCRSMYPCGTAYADEN
ncbi:MAG: ABC transporter substrate-binding protein, partial [Burkholderiaceae bacterium]